MALLGACRSSSPADPCVAACARLTQAGCGRAGLGPEDALDTDYDVLGEILNEDGLAKLKAYFDAKPPTTIEERRRMISAFLDKFADPAALEVELPLPGWTDDLVAEITDAYLRDCAAIARFPGVTFITP